MKCQSYERLQVHVDLFTANLNLTFRKAHKQVITRKDRVVLTSLASNPAVRCHTAVNVVAKR